MLFDGRNKKWTPDSGVDHIHNENIIFDATSEDIVNEKRIGSKSTMAEVYLVSIREFKVACKILPIDSDESLERNIREISFAKEASEEGIYFPKVYDFIFCEDTYFYDTGFYNKSKRYQQYTYLLEMNPEEMKPLILNYKKRFIDAEVASRLLMNEFRLPHKIFSNLLFSQVAEYDLDYYLFHKVLTTQELQNLLSNIFKAIETMHTKLHLVHNDLHLGNILIINDHPLIHDFGKSYKSTFESVKDRQKDIFYFLAQLYDKVELPNQIKTLLDEVSNIVMDSEAKYPINEVVNYWTLNI